MRLLHCWSFLSLLALVPQATYASVLAIDYGSDWMKASLMKPGVPFDVLLNKDSKRKIQSVVGWKKSDRLFGSDAFNLAARFPSDSFSSVKLLEAAPFDSEVVQYYTKISIVDVIETPRKTVALKQSDGTEWSVEELTAMQFAYIKHLAETFAEEKVRDVIVTVPPYYSQFERDAIVDAIEISGLRTLALINDGTAVAVNYAMTRTFPIPEYHIIFDAGASSIRATVASFTTANDPKTDVSGTHIAVAGVGYDRSTGGTELDRRLRDILIEAFNAKHKRNVREDKRGMTKLWKEAQRVKAILSANSEAVSTVESVAWDIDFKTKVSRATFEDACDDLKDRFAQPIADALKTAGLTLDNITSVILTGGSSRTPMIQNAVKAAVGEDKIALNVNADEAAVLGAALHGASLSRQFKTKNIKVTDITLHDIQASYFAAPTTANSRPRSITTGIFPAGSKVGTKKTLTFKRKEDFTIFLDYKNPVAPGFPTRMLEAELVGVTEAIANLTERGATDPVVKATLTLSESGFVSVTDAIAFGEIKDDSITGKLKGFFGAGSSSSEDPTSESVENAPPRDTETSPTSSSSASSSASPSAEAKVEKKAPVENTISLNITTSFTTIAPMTVDEKKTSRGRLRALDAEEAAKNRKEEARNTFESYLYRLRDLLDSDNHESPFRKCSQEKERQAIADKLDDSFQWLYDRGDLAETSQFLDKRNALETLERPIVHRYQEIEAFPQALNNSQMWNWSTRLFLTEARQNLTAEAEADLPSKWTKEELDALEKTLREHEAWLSEWVEKQKSVKSNEDPVIETTEMKARAKVLETHLQKLWKRKIPKAKKPKPVTTTAEPEPTAQKDAEGEPIQEEQPIGGEDEQQVPLKEPEKDGYTPSSISSPFISILPGYFDEPNYQSRCRIRKILQETKGPYSPYDIFLHTPYKKWTTSGNSHSPAAPGKFTIFSSLLREHYSQLHVCTRGSSFFVAKILDLALCLSTDFLKLDPFLHCQPLLTNETWAYKQLSDLDGVPRYFDTYTTTMHPNNRVVGVLLLEYINAPHLSSAETTVAENVMRQVVRLSREARSRGVVFNFSTLRTFYLDSENKVITCNFVNVRQWSSKEERSMRKASRRRTWERNECELIIDMDLTECTWIPQDKEWLDSIPDTCDPKTEWGRSVGGKRRAQTKTEGRSGHGPGSTPE